MISANEIRIGNWVYDLLETPLQVEVLINIPQHLMNPIPLTPELLLKCGFKSAWSDTHFTHYNFNALRISMCIKKSEGICKTELGVFYYLSHGPQYKHLHQLQNLYFALTGEELIVNL